MRRHEFEHVVAAAAAAVGLDEFIVIGSQAILGSVPDPPDELLVSMEVDMYPKADPDRAEAVDGAIGDGSMFQVTFGYYAHGVGPETATLPAGWQDRLVRAEIPPRRGGIPAVAWCVERHDLVAAKLARGAERDWNYARATLDAGLVQGSTLLSRVDDLPLDAPQRDRIAKSLRAVVK